MKQIRIFLLAAIAFIATSFSTSAQTYSKGDIKTAIALLDQQCPEDLGDGMVMQSVKLVDNSIEATLRTNEDDDTINMIAAMSSQLSPMFAQQFKSEPDIADLFALCKANKINFTIVITNRTGAKANIVIRYQDM